MIPVHFKRIFFFWLYSPIQALAASMKLSVSLQLLDLGQLVGLLGRVISSHGPGVRASEDSSCLRPLGYRDRLGSERAKTVHALDRSATVTGKTYAATK
jgi:hypothetical protein